MSWPGFSWQTLDPSRLVAIEGGLFVVSSSGMLHADVMPADFPGGDAILEGLGRFAPGAADGGAVICDPSGAVLAQGDPGEETMIVADLDIEATIRPRAMRDQGGHYHRPDVFDLTIDRRRRGPASFTD